MTRIILLLAILVLVGMELAEAQEDAAARDVPYLYYYSDVLNAFVVERADGSDSRTLGEGLVPEGVNYFTGPGWSPSGRWFAWRAFSYQDGSTGTRYAYVIASDGSIFQRINGLPDTFLSWSPTADLLLVIERSGEAERGANGFPHFMMTTSLINMHAQDEIVSFQRDIFGIPSMEFGVSAITWSPDGSEVRFGYAPYSEASPFYSVEVSITLDGEVKELRHGGGDFVPEIMFYDPSSIMQLHQTIYSPSGRYVTVYDLGYGHTLDLQTDSFIEYPTHRLATYVRGGGYRWHPAEEYLIKGDATVIAGGDNGFRAVGVTNASGTYWRELGACYFTQLCANWLPSQVAPEYLLPLAALEDTGVDGN